MDVNQKSNLWDRHSRAVAGGTAACQSWTNQRGRCVSAVRWSRCGGAAARDRRGLTLIELMIVLIILVMLFAIAGPRLLGTQEKADVKGTLAQIGNLESALKMYAVDMRTFPSTEDGLAALIKPPADEVQARKWAGPYLDDEVVPADAWGRAFVYEYPPINGERDFPNISSVGKDGEAETEDDIVNWRDSDEGGDAGDVPSAADAE